MEEEIIANLDDEVQITRRLVEIKDDDKKLDIFLRTLGRWLSDGNLKIPCFFDIFDSFSEEKRIEIANDTEIGSELGEEAHEIIRAFAIATMHDDKAKVSYLDEGYEEFKPLVIGRIEDDSLRESYFDKLNGEDSKAIAVAAMESDDKKIEYLPKLEDYFEKATIIASIKDDDKKIELLEANFSKLFEGEYLTTTFSMMLLAAKTIHDDDKKINFILSKTSTVSEICERAILPTVKDYNKKIELLSNPNISKDTIEKIAYSIEDIDEKIRILSSLGITYFKRDENGLLSEEQKIQSLEVIKDERKKANILCEISEEKRIELLVTLTDPEAKAIVIRSFPDDIKIELLNEGQLKRESDILSVLKSISNEELRMSQIRMLGDSSTRRELIMSIENPESRLKYLNFLYSNSDVAEVVNSIEDENKKIKLLREGLIEGKQDIAKIIINLKNEQDRINLIYLVGDDINATCNILKTIDNDDVKLKYMDRILRFGSHKKEAVLLIHDDDKRLSLINYLNNDDKIVIIGSLSDDNKKLQALLSNNLSVTEFRIKHRLMLRI